VPLVAEAQQPRPVARIGVLSAPTLPDVDADALRFGLRDRGYVDGHNLRIEWRSAHGNVERLGSLAADLVAAKVDVIVTVAPPAASAAKTATTSIPIIFTIISDPVVLGLVRSLAHPGGNVTGVSRRFKVNSKASAWSSSKKCFLR